jgi:hypothetical protein
MQLKDLRHPPRPRSYFSRSIGKKDAVSSIVRRKHSSIPAVLRVPISLPVPTKNSVRREMGREEVHKNEISAGFARNVAKNRPETREPYKGMASRNSAGEDGFHLVRRRFARSDDAIRRPAAPPRFGPGPQFESVGRTERPCPETNAFSSARSIRKMIARRAR